MKDVAAAAGVAQSTVSRILNDAPVRISVTATTRERVHAIARDLGYRPHPIARALRGAPTMQLGAVVLAVLFVLLQVRPVLMKVGALNRPGNRGARIATLESALFESGRPVLMAPPFSPKSFGQTVLIHWNASTEVCRAISMAMPILCKAERVMLLTVEGSVVSGPTAKDALGHAQDAAGNLIDRARGGADARRDERETAEDRR